MIQLDKDLLKTFELLNEIENEFKQIKKNLKIIWKTNKTPTKQ